MKQHPQIAPIGHDKMCMRPNSDPPPRTPKPEGTRTNPTPRGGGGEWEGHDQTRLLGMGGMQWEEHAHVGGHDNP